jgi:hypothetical protein
MSHLFMEELIERVEVDRVLSCLSEGEIALCVNCNVGVITFIGKNGEMPVVVLGALLHENSACHNLLEHFLFS